MENICRREYPSRWLRYPRERQVDYVQIVSTSTEGTRSLSHLAILYQLQGLQRADDVLRLYGSHIAQFLQRSRASQVSTLYVKTPPQRDHVLANAIAGLVIEERATSAHLTPATAWFNKSGTRIALGLGKTTPDCSLESSFEDLATSPQL